MDIVLGVSMAPSTVRMVLVEGENADGVTVDEDNFDLSGAEADTARVSGPSQVVSAILGTRESAAEGGYQLTSTGVTFSDQAEAAVLRDLLAEHKVENVMLVSSFLAAAALAQAVGGAVGYARTALMFLEPQTATLAVVDSADGSIAEVTRQSLSGVDPLVELTSMVAGVEGLASRPDGVFVVGSGVEIAGIKPRLEAVTSLPVSAPEEPGLALARGAALASANAPLFASSTMALAWAKDPGTGQVYPDALAISYGYVPPGTADDDATQDVNPLAYSAVSDDTEFDSASPNTNRRGRTPLLFAGSAAAALFIVGIAALVISLAVGIRPTIGSRPNPGGHAVVSTTQVAPPPPVAAPAPPPPVAAPAPPPVAAPAPPPVAAPAPASVVAPALPPQTVQRPAPVVRQAPPATGVPQWRAPQPSVAAPVPQVAPPPPPAAPPPPPPAAPPVPPLPPMTVYLHLPFVTIPIPINQPPPPPG